MVFFTCNACGESLKKGQVEKHLSICRNCQCLSCIDCGKDFWGEDYKNHIKCISEDQKYGGKGFESKSNKGDVKQQQWIQKIQEVAKKPDISANIRRILGQISTYDNIPRKKAKFQNWMKNSLKIHNQALQEQVWEIFAEATSTEKPELVKTSLPVEPQSESSEQQEETEKKKSKRERKEERQKKNKKEKKDLSAEEQGENEKKNGKKRKIEDEEGNEEEEEEEEEAREDVPKGKKKRDAENLEQNGNKEDDAPKRSKKKKHKKATEEQQEQNIDENYENEEGGGKFNWKGTIKALLKRAPDNELPIKRLRKKVIAQYYTVSSAQHKSEVELLATFKRKLHSNPKFRVLKEKVKLVQ